MTRSIAVPGNPRARLADLSGSMDLPRGSFGLAGSFQGGTSYLAQRLAQSEGDGFSVFDFFTVCSLLITELAVSA